MKLHFDSNQNYQINAVESVVKLFDGQPLRAGDFEFSLSEDSASLGFNELGFGNMLMLSEEQVTKNLEIVQKMNNVFLKEAAQSDKKLNEGMNFSIEMETGTGKTYVYLRTIYELNKVYGFRKFVIVVPSIAIKEGVLKNLEITHEHFQNLYNNTPCSYFVYDSKKVSNLRTFASSNSIQILVINIDSFSKDVNVINNENDRLSGRKPIEFVSSANPIVIVDEPQNMETENRRRAIESLNPLCTLRYSATHTNLYNQIYSLDPVRAYDLGLVKQIEVDSVFVKNDHNQAYIAVGKINNTRSKVTAKIKIDVNSDEGAVRKIITVKPGDDLYNLSESREMYKDGFIVSEIDSANGTVTFSNGLELQAGTEQGAFADDIMKLQIRKTIEEHLKKEKRLKPYGIKVLSLFFIDRVSNYRSYDNDGKQIKGKLAEWFEQVFQEEISKPLYRDLNNFRLEEIHNGYFAQDKFGHFKDSTTRETLADDDTYRLIMKDKERLLDINHPLRFIFSHSALREGWDNPNVFQICTLNETRSELKKRQEIGRGLRLAVNQEGQRTFDKNINRLTVIANESYEDFAKQLQKEIQKDCNVDFKDRIKNKNEKIEVRLKKNYNLDRNFMELWNRIKYKTIYNVNFETKELIEDSTKEIKNMAEITAPVLVSQKVKLDIKDEGVTAITTGLSLPVEIQNLTFPIPDVVGYVQERTELTRKTIVQILLESGRINDILKNPQLFLENVVSEIRKVLDKQIVNGIKYEKLAGNEYEMKLFESGEIDTYIENVRKAENQEKTLYDYVRIDSEIERKFAEDCENNDNIEFYIKLPGWFVIQTPIGPYNPDWALIFKDESKLYFVAETKGSTDYNELRVSEEMKIQYGRKHFEEFEGIEYKAVESLTDLIQ